MKETLNIWIFKDWRLWSIEWEYRKWELSWWEDCDRIVKTKVDMEDIEKLRNSNSENVQNVLNEILKKYEKSLTLY